MTMTYARLLTISCLCVAFTACTNKGSDDKTAAAPVTQQETAANEMHASGMPMSESTAVSVVTDAQEVSSGRAMDMANFPLLTARKLALASVNRVVETDARSFDLYHDSVLVLTLNKVEGSASSLVWGQGLDLGENATASYEETGSAQDQSNLVNSIRITSQECRIVPEEKGEEQGQDKGQDKGQGKESPVVAPTPAPQEQDQDQKQGKEEKPVEKPVVQECAAIEATLTLEKIVKKEEQSQEKQEEKKDEKQEDKKGDDKGQGGTKQG